MKSPYERYLRRKKRYNLPALAEVEIDTRPGAVNVYPNGWVKYTPGAEDAARRAAGWREDPAARKERPIATHVIDYFPDALAEVARVSLAGNRQHGTTGWDRTKSTDEANTLIRHFVDRGKLDTDGQRHSAKVAWRALALLQKELEAEREPEKEIF